MNFVIDANCWKAYAEDNLRMVVGCGQKIFDKARAAGKIAMDEGGHIKHRYLACMPGQEAMLQLFIEELTISGKLKLVVPTATQGVRKDFRELGIPNEEWIFLRTAIACAPSIVISNDVDFFNPKLKAASAKAHRACKENPNAPVCKKMRKSHAVEVLWGEAYAA